MVRDRAQASVAPALRRPSSRLLTRGALGSLAAMILVTTAWVLEPFAHGLWLIAYLGLVGSLAQWLLGHGQARLLSVNDLRPPLRRERLVQGLLWNLGVVAVPIGVLEQTRLAVLVGSLALLGALASLLMTVRPVVGRADGGLRQAGLYLALLLFMTASVFIGLGLSWGIPWT